jgi:hypothetical protein
MSLDLRLFGEVYAANITHRLADVAKEAGIYGLLWHPDENGYPQAFDLIEPLEQAIADMEARPYHYEQFDADVGQVRLAQFLPWLRDLLRACRAHPEAVVESDV